MELSQILGYIATLLFSVMYLPQIIKTLKSKSIADVSIPMFIVGFIANIDALCYATMIHQTPLQIKYSIALAVLAIYIGIYYHVRRINGYHGDKMILISNNVQKYMTLPPKAVIRINMAWVETIKELQTIIESNENSTIFLDYPEGRAKPPKPVLSFADAYKMCKKYPNIKYFAVSNIESVKRVLEIQKNIPATTEFVPKIETLEGVKNIAHLVYDCGIKSMMLDKEDLYTDAKKNNIKFFKAVKHARDICEGLKINLLELEGVVFVTRTKNE